VPTQEPIKEAINKGLMSFQLIFFLRKSTQLAVPEPIAPCSLFVPSAINGGMPVSIKAGIVSSPPPPAKVSRNPAKAASKNNISSISADRLISSNGCPLSFEWFKLALPLM